jgi:hypothetical protein
MPKSTPAQTFKRIFDTWMHPGTLAGDRTSAERQMDAWLKRHGKTRADISAILVQADKDDAAQAPPPPPPDPHDTKTSPFDDPAFNPAEVVSGITAKYVASTSFIAVRLAVRGAR